MNRFLKCLLLGLALTGGISVSMAAATDEAPSAQTLLFDASYLLPLKAPSRLVYSYSNKTADPALFGRSFDDEVALKLSASAEGKGEKDVTLDMFTGDRQRVVGPLVNVSGNPIIMMFLESDVSQMKMHIGGQPVYYRNIIRLALRDKAKLEPAKFSWDGHEVEGTKVTIHPFADDPNGERLQLFRTKTYEFIVSDAVPGGIYQIHSSMTPDLPEAASQPTPPAIDVTMTLKEIAYDQPKN